MKIAEPEVPMNHLRKASSRRRKKVSTANKRASATRSQTLDSSSPLHKNYRHLSKKKKSKKEQTRRSSKSIWSNKSLLKLPNYYFQTKSPTSLASKRTQSNSQNPSIPICSQNRSQPKTLRRQINSRKSPGKLTLSILTNRMLISNSQKLRLSTNN